MKKTILVLVILTGLNSCTQNLTCADFKTGKFKYLDSSYSEWIITRTDSTQTETNLKNGNEYFGSISWKTDCKYVLTYKKIPDSHNQDVMDKEIQIEIIETYNNKYLCVSKMDTIEMKFEFLKLN